MAFIPHEFDGGYKPAIVKLPAAAITPVVGMGLAFNASGQLAASTTPTHICMQAGDVVAAGTPIQVMRINPAIIFESELDGTSAFKAGKKAKLTADGLTIDGDGDGDGAFFIEEMDGTEAGSKVRGRFL